MQKYSHANDFTFNHVTRMLDFITWYFDILFEIQRELFQLPRNISTYILCLRPPTVRMHNSSFQHPNHSWYQVTECWETKLSLACNQIIFSLADNSLWTIHTYKKTEKMASYFPWNFIMLLTFQQEMAF